MLYEQAIQNKDYINYAHAIYKGVHVHGQRLCTMVVLWVCAYCDRAGLQGRPCADGWLYCDTPTLHMAHVYYMYTYI